MFQAQAPTAWTGSGEKRQERTGFPALIAQLWTGNMKGRRRTDGVLAGRVKNFLRVQPEKVAVLSWQSGLSRSEYADTS